MKSIDRLRDILANREEGYGGSEQTLNNIGAMWSTYLTMLTDGQVRFELGGDSVAEMMVLLKIARAAGKTTDSAQDDRLDQAGYALLGADIAESYREQEQEPGAGTEPSFQLGFRFDES